MIRGLTLFGGKAASATPSLRGEGGRDPNASTGILGSTATTTTPSDLFLRMALEQIAQAKEAKKLDSLREACRVALGRWGRGPLLVCCTLACTPLPDP